MTNSLFAKSLEVLKRKREENKYCPPEKINTFSFDADSEVEMRAVGGIIANAYGLDTMARIFSSHRDTPSIHEIQRIKNLNLEIDYDAANHTGSFTLPPGYLIADLERYVKCKEISYLRTLYP